MDLQYLRKLIKLVTDTGVEEIELEEEGTRIRITRSCSAQPLPIVPQHSLQPHPGPAVAQAISAPAAFHEVEKSAAAPKPAEEANHYIIRSPIVGTFYRSSSPDAEPYVQAGQTVTNGFAVCIIEAMKIMNEIESDKDGKIIKILVENGMPVEYNQPLFLLELT